MRLKSKPMKTQYTVGKCKCRWTQAIWPGGKIHWTPIFCDKCKEAAHVAGMKVIMEAK